MSDTVDPRRALPLGDAVSPYMLAARRSAREIVTIVEFADPSSPSAPNGAFSLYNLASSKPIAHMATRLS